MKLLNPTDERLNAVFAEKVAGLTGLIPNSGFTLRSDGSLLPQFTQSAEAVFPWLEKWRTIAIDWDRITGLWSVGVGEHKNAPTYDKALPRAACIALLRAHGVEVEFTA